MSPSRSCPGAVEIILTYPHAIARSSMSTLMPMAWGARGGYTATFHHGVLESLSSFGYDGKPQATVTAYTADRAEQLQLADADQYTAMIDHVLACLRGEDDNQITPASVLNTLTLTLDIDHSVNGQP